MTVPRPNDAVDRESAHQPQFDLLTDDGLDGFPSLRNDAPVVPFPLHFGDEAFRSTEMPLSEVFDRMRSGGPHPTTSQPAPTTYADAYRRATRPLLVVTVSAALSGSHNSADQARALAPDAEVTLHDSGTVSAAQAFQVHAASTARDRGLDVATAIDWMRRVHAATDLFFTVDSLEYLRRGGRIGRIQAAVGSMLDLKPIATVDKTVGVYDTVGRTRSWRKAIETMAKQAADRYAPDEPIRVGLVRAEGDEDAEALLRAIERRNVVAWSDVTDVGAALAVHTGPKAVAFAVAPAAWPWEDDATA